MSGAVEKDEPGCQFGLIHGEKGYRRIDSPGEYITERITKGNSLMVTHICGCCISKRETAVAIES
ncbi:hypothetical protein GCM10020255_036340 [Rhodococcus baikonurensis]